MHFSEDDLRQALKRKDPGEGFTQRVMARVNQADAKSETLSATKGRGWFLLRWWNLRPAWTFAAMAVLLLGFAWGGYQYAEYRHGEIARENQQRLEEAERARDQAVLALRIARSKLNHVLQQAQLPAETDDKTRRQRL
jgi:hypothetical protein